MNEHIEHYKRWSAAYLMWANSNFDRIVADVIRRDREAEAKRKKEPLYAQMRTLLEQSNHYLERLEEQYARTDEVNWFVVAGGLPVGTTLKVKLPADYEVQEPSLLCRIIAALPSF